MGVDSLFSDRNKRWVRWFLVLALLAATLPLVHRQSQLPVYVEAASRFLAGEQFYRPDDPPAFSYPPFLVLPFTALAPWSGYPQAALWWLVNLTLGALSVSAIAKMIRPTILLGAALGGPPAWVAAAGIALMGGRFAISPYSYQSNDVIVLYLLLLALHSLADESDARTGLWGGLAAACKATPLLILPVLVWQKKFTAATCFCIALALATVAPDVLVRNPQQELWVTTWHRQFIAKVGIAQAPDVAGAWFPWNPLNQSLTGTFYRLFTPVPNDGERTSVAIAELSARQQRHYTLAAYLAVLICLAWATSPVAGSIASSDRARVVLGQGGCIVCSMLLLSPMSSTQHFVVLIVPITYLVVAFLYGPRRRWLGATLGLLFFLGPLGAQDIVGAAWADRLQAYGGATLFTLVALFASSLILSSERARLRKVKVLDENPAPLGKRHSRELRGYHESL